MPKAKAPPAPPGPAWKPAQRRALAGSRRPHPLDPPRPPTSREEGWRALLAAERAEDERSGPVSCKNPAAQELHTTLRQGYERDEPPAQLDPTTERMRAALLHTHHGDGDVDLAYQALVAFWVGTAGLGFVLDVCRAPEPWSYTTGNGGRVLVGPPDAADSRGSGWGRFEYSTLLRELRRLLFALDEASFRVAHDQGLAWLARHGDEIEEHQRPREAAALAYALARDPTLAHERVRRMLDERLFGGYAHLLSSITDLTQARTMVEKYAGVLDIEGALVALDVVETFGRDAAELMQAVLDHAARRKPALKPFYKGRFEAAKKLALTDPRPPTP